MKFLIPVLVFLSSSLVYAATCSSDICRVVTGTTDTILRHSLCTTVTNASGKDLLIATKTAPELQSFISTPAIAGITKVPCPPFYVDGKKQTGWSSGTTMQIAKPTGLAVGDLLVSLIYAEQSLVSVIPPTGFTSLYAGSSVWGTYYTSTFYKVANASDVAASNFTFSRTGTWNNAGGFILNYRNVNTTTPIADHKNNIAASGAVTWLGGTQSTANSTILLVGAADPQPGTPSGFTAQGGTFYNSLDVRIADKVEAAAGPTGSFSAGSSSTWVTTLIIINPL